MQSYLDANEKSFTFPCFTPFTIRNVDVTSANLTGYLQERYQYKILEITSIYGRTKSVGFTKAKLLYV